MYEVGERGPEIFRPLRFECEICGHPWNNQRSAWECCAESD